MLAGWLRCGHINASIVAQNIFKDINSKPNSVNAQTLTYAKSSANTRINTRGWPLQIHTLKARKLLMSYIGWVMRSAGSELGV